MWDHCTDRFEYVPQPWYRQPSQSIRNSLTRFWHIDNISICSWNARVFFCCDPAKWKRKHEYLLQLLDRYDIIIIQESHDDLAKHVFLDTLLNNMGQIFHNPGTTSSGGTFIVIRQAFRDKYNEAHNRIIHKGRIQRLTLSGNMGNLDIVNLHLEPAATTSEKIQQLERISGVKAHCKHSCLIIGGDFNFTEYGDDRFNSASSHGNSLTEDPLDSCCLRTWWIENMSDLTEHYQSNHTRSGYILNGALSSARLDRIFSNIPVEFNITHSIINSTLGCANGCLHNYSDHVPVASSITMARKGGKRVSIPRWIFKHKHFPVLVQAIYSEMPSSLNH